MRLHVTHGMGFHRNTIIEGWSNYLIDRKVWYELQWETTTCIDHTRENTGCKFWQMKNTVQHVWLAETTERAITKLHTERACTTLTRCTYTYPYTRHIIIFSFVCLTKPVMGETLLWLTNVLWCARSSKEGSSCHIIMYCIATIILWIGLLWITLAKWNCSCSTNSLLWGYILSTNFHRQLYIHTSVIMTWTH